MWFPVYIVTSEIKSWHERRYIGCYKLCIVPVDTTGLSLLRTIDSKENEVLVFDSIFCNVDEETKKVIFHLFQCSSTKKIRVVKSQKQKGTKDCGLFNCHILPLLLDKAKIWSEINEITSHLLLSQWQTCSTSMIACLHGTRTIISIYVFTIATLMGNKIVKFKNQTIIM